MENLVAKQTELIFCFPFRGPGGVSLLFLRLANYLQSRGYNVSIIDYEDGFMALNNLEQVPLIKYSDNNKVFVSKHSTIIFQTMTPWSIFHNLELDDMNKVFFITTIPSNLFPNLPGKLNNLFSRGDIVTKLFWKFFFNHEYKNLKGFLENLFKKNSISFLDFNCVDVLEKSFNTNLPHPKILPLFTEHRKEDVNLYKNNEINKIKVAWLGRIADFKIHILNKVLKDLNALNNANHQVDFYIVGDGELSKNLIETDNPNLRVINIKYLNPAHIQDFLSEIDILFAMGTSAIEGASIGVPTIVLDYSFSVIEDYSYKYIFELNDLCLGSSTSSNSYLKGIHSMENIINSITNETSRKELSIKSFDYAKENHSINSSAHHFINHLKVSNMTWKDVKLYGYSLKYNIYKYIKS